MTDVPQTWTPKINWIGHDNGTVSMVPAKFGMWISVSDYAAAIARAEAAEAERDHILVERHKHQIRAIKAEARERSAWEAGRDAAAAVAEKRYDLCEKTNIGPCYLRKCAIGRVIRALTLPDNIGGNDE